MPSCYNLLLHRHDLHQKSFCELTVRFREVLWLDCILPGGSTLRHLHLKPSLYELTQPLKCRLSSPVDRMLS